MSRRSVHDDEAAASVLALMVAANGCIDPREIRTIEALQAFERLGVRREQFLALAHGCLDVLGPALYECSWLPSDAVDYIDALLDRVDDAPRRMLVCRLAAAAITADGCVSVDERLVYRHVLGRWRISQSMVTQAILQDPVR